MRPSPRVYGVGPHLDKSGLMLPFLRWRSPGNLWVAVWVRNLSAEELDACAFLLPLRPTDEER
jgi:hypothetical protein